VGSSTCNDLVPRFNWVLALADQQSQAGWESFSAWPRAQAELSTSQLKLNYILALQWNQARGEWVMDATSSVVPPSQRTIGFLAGCDNKPGFCTQHQPIDTIVTAMAQAAYSNWDEGVAAQCSPGYWANQYNIFSYTNVGNPVAPYSTPAMQGDQQLNYLNPDFACKPLNSLNRPDGCMCRDASGNPSVTQAITIANPAGQPCSWSTADDVQAPSLNNAGQTPQYLAPVYFDQWGQSLGTTPAVAQELAKFFVGAGDWQTKFAPSSMNNPTTQGLGPPAMAFVISVVGPANRFAFYAMNQVILNRGPSNEGQCDPTTMGGNCWQNGAGEYDFLEAPFWGNGQTQLNTSFQVCNSPPYYIYDSSLPMDRLYLTASNSSGQCNPMVSAPAAGGAGSALFFQTADIKLDKGAGLAANTWLYAFVFDQSGIQAFRWRGDQTGKAWPNMPVTSDDVQSGQGKTFSSWDGTSITPASPPPASTRISQAPPSMTSASWTQAWNATASQPAGLYMPACRKGSTDPACMQALSNLPGQINWWDAYASILGQPDGSFTPGVDPTQNFCVNQAAKSQCGSACSIKPGPPLGVMYDPNCANGGTGCNWGGQTNCRLCQPSWCPQSGTSWVTCPAK
jgi:hypothetical protein